VTWQRIAQCTQRDHFDQWLKCHRIGRSGTPFPHLQFMTEGVAPPQVPENARQHVKETYFATQKSSKAEHRSLLVIFKHNTFQMTLNVFDSLKLENNATFTTIL